MPSSLVMSAVKTHPLHIRPGEKQRHLWCDDISKSIDSIGRADENIEISNHEVVVECDQVDSLKLNFTNPAGEFEGEFAFILPLAVVSEIVNRVYDQAEEVMHQLATLEFIKIRWSAQRDVFSE